MKCIIDVKIQNDAVILYEYEGILYRKIVPGYPVTKEEAVAFGIFYVLTQYSDIDEIIIPIQPFRLKKTFWNSEIETLKTEREFEIKCSHQ